MSDNQTSPRRPEVLDTDRETTTERDEGFLQKFDGIAERFIKEGGVLDRVEGGVMTVVDKGVEFAEKRPVLALVMLGGLLWAVSGSIKSGVEKLAEKAPGLKRLLGLAGFLGGSGAVAGGAYLLFENFMKGKWGAVLDQFKQLVKEQGPEKAKEILAGQIGEENAKKVIEMYEKGTEATEDVGGKFKEWKEKLGVDWDKYIKDNGLAEKLPFELPDFDTILGWAGIGAGTFVATWGLKEVLGMAWGKSPFGFFGHVLGKIISAPFRLLSFGGGLVVKHPVLTLATTSAVLFFGLDGEAKANIEKTAEEQFNKFITENETGKRMWKVLEPIGKKLEEAKEACENFINEICAVFEDQGWISDKDGFFKKNFNINIKEYLQKTTNENIEEFLKNKGANLSLDKWSPKDFGMAIGISSAIALLFVMMEKSGINRNLFSSHLMMFAGLMGSAYLVRDFVQTGNNPFNNPTFLRAKGTVKGVGDVIFRHLPTIDLSNLPGDLSKFIKEKIDIDITTLPEMMGDLGFDIPDFHLQATEKAGIIEQLKKLQAYLLEQGFDDDQKEKANDLNDLITKTLNNLEKGHVYVSRISLRKMQILAQDLGITFEAQDDEKEGFKFLILNEVIHLQENPFDQETDNEVMDNAQEKTVRGLGEIKEVLESAHKGDARRRAFGGSSKEKDVIKRLRPLIDAIARIIGLINAKGVENISKEEWEKLLRILGTEGKIIKEEKKNSIIKYEFAGNVYFMGFSFEALKDIKLLRQVQSYAEGAWLSDSIQYGLRDAASVNYKIARDLYNSIDDKDFRASLLEMQASPEILTSTTFWVRFLCAYLKYGYNSKDGTCLKIANGCISLYYLNKEYLFNVPQELILGVGKEIFSGEWGKVAGHITAGNSILLFPIVTAGVGGLIGLLPKLNMLNGMKLGWQIGSAPIYPARKMAEAIMKAPVTVARVGHIFSDWEIYSKILADMPKLRAIIGVNLPIFSETTLSRLAPETLEQLYLYLNRMKAFWEAHEAFTMVGEGHFWKSKGMLKLGRITEAIERVIKVYGSKRSITDAAKELSVLIEGGEIARTGAIVPKDLIIEEIKQKEITRRGIIKSAYQKTKERLGGFSSGELQEAKSISAEAKKAIEEAEALVKKAKAVGDEAGLASAQAELTKAQKAAAETWENILKTAEETLAKAKAGGNKGEITKATKELAILKKAYDLVKFRMGKLAKVLGVAGKLIKFVPAAVVAIDVAGGILEYRAASREENEGVEAVKKSQAGVHMALGGVYAFAMAHEAGAMAGVAATAGAAAATVAGFSVVGAVESVRYLYDGITESAEESLMTAQEWAKKPTDQLFHELLSTADDLSAGDKYRAFFTTDTGESILQEKVNTRLKLWEAILANDTEALSQQGTFSPEEVSKFLVYRLIYLKAMTNNFLVSDFNQIRDLIKRSGYYAQAIMVRNQLLEKRQNGEQIKDTTCVLPDGRSFDLLEASGVTNNPKLIKEITDWMENIITEVDKESGSEKKEPKLEDNPMTYALYEAAKYLGYTGDGTLKDMRENFFTAEFKGQRAIYWNGKEWVLNEAGMERDDKMGSNDHEAIKAIMARLDIDTDDVLEARGAKVVDLSYTGITDALSRQAMMINNKLHDGYSKWQQLHASK